MSNLGTYQWITTTSKKMGGPVPFLCLTAVGGYALIRVIEAGGKKVIKLIKASSQNRISAAPCFVVQTDATSNEGVMFKSGDKLRVLESDGESILIDRINDTQSPYFVSADFLSSITEYQK